jgi:hypothetical protein
MFIKSRCLYIINSEKSNGDAVYSELSKLGLNTKFFNSSKKSKNLVDFLRILPDQTVFSKSISHIDGESSSYFISLPFFSSHFKMPLKVGEYVWIYRYEKGPTLFNSSFDINSYWVSRIHAFSISEDVNYTYGDRDSLIGIINSTLSTDLEEQNSKSKRANKKRSQKQHNDFLKTKMVMPYTDFGEKTFELDIDELSYVNNYIGNRSHRSVPHITKMSDDAIIQGSNSTLIRLSSVNSSNSDYNNTSNQGEITISAGIGKFVKNDFTPIKGSLVNQKGLEHVGSKFFVKKFKSKKLPNVITYNNKEESIKHAEFYSVNKEDYKDSLEVGATSVKEDASRLTLTEAYDFYDEVYSSLDKNLNLVTFSHDLEDTNLNSSLKDSDKSFVLGKYNKTAEDKKLARGIPNINMSSSSISLLCRKSDGEIGLIKEYNEKKSGKDIVSAIRIDKDGDILIDGSRIFIGSSSLEKSRGTFENGKGTLIRLGESEEMQSLVLGEQLKAYFQEILDVSRENMHETKSLFESVSSTRKDINKSITDELSSALTNFSSQIKDQGPAAISGAGVASGGVTVVISLFSALNANLTSAVNNIKTLSTNKISDLERKISQAQLNKDEVLSQRLALIENNIDKILSKISKTS